MKLLRFHSLIHPFVGAVCVVSAVGCSDGEPVRPPEPVALQVRVATIFAGSARLVRGSSVPLIARPVAADSTVVGEAVAARWTSPDQRVATVDQHGVVQAVAFGTVNIQAVYTVAGRVLSGTIPIGVD